MGLKMTKDIRCSGSLVGRSTGLQEEHSQDVVEESTDLYISFPIWNKKLLCK